MLRFLSPVLIASVVLLACSSQQNNKLVENQDSQTENPSSLGFVAGKRAYTAPFEAGQSGYAVYRAPTMVISQKGTVLAFAEGRVNGSADEDDMDVVLRRSTDGGRTWEKLQVLVNDGKNPCKNQSPVVLPNGRILLVYLWNPWIPSESLRDTISRSVFTMYSDDDGKTWSKPKDITAMAQIMKGPEKWGWTGMGPVHGIVKRQEPYKGRIVFPSRHNTKNTNMVSHVIYSDDNGETWKIGGSSRDKTTESTVVELSNGDLMLNSRNMRDSEDYRVVAISKDGGETFDKKSLRLDPSLVEPSGVQASLLYHSLNPKTGLGNILFSNPSDDKMRTNGTLQVSNDNGLTWSERVRYAPAPAPYFTGYSDLIRFPNGDVGVLFESGKYDPDNPKGDRYEKIEFTVVNTAELLSLRPDNTGGASTNTCRVYASFEDVPKEEKESLTMRDCRALCAEWTSRTNLKGLPKQVRCEWGFDLFQRYEEGTCEVKVCYFGLFKNKLTTEDLTREECRIKCGRYDSWKDRSCRWNPDSRHTPWQVFKSQERCSF